MITAYRVRPLIVVFLVSALLLTGFADGVRTAYGYPGQADTDNDGVNDSADVDDDNDGILDTDEGLDLSPSGLAGAVPPGQVSFDITSASPTTSNIDHTLNSFTITGSASIDGTYSDFIAPDTYAEGFTGADPDGADVDELLLGVSQGSLDDASWNTDVVDAFQSRNLSHFQRMDSGPFASDDLYRLSYNVPIVATGSGFLMIAERGGNNTQYIEAFDISSSSLGSIVVSTADYADTGHRANNSQNVEIAIFPLDLLASVGSQISYIEIKQTITTDVTDGGDGKVFIINGGCLDSDGDGVCNHIDLDSDNDGIGDLYESGNATIIGLDTDGNGTVDSTEDTPAGNGLPSSLSGVGVTPTESSLDADTVADYIDLDADGDGIPDATEVRPSSDYIAYPGTIDTTADSDDDGILDIFDSDGSSVPGATTFGSTLSGFKSATRAPNDDGDDSDGLPDYLDLDSDGDGTPDSDAEESGTITGVSFADPDGNVNDPLASGVLDNDDSDLTGADVDFRSIDSDNPPVITLVGDSTIEVVVNTSYTDAGATATDVEDGNLTSSIVTADNFDITKVGTYTFTYNVTDSDSNAATQVTRTVHVVAAADNDNITPAEEDAAPNGGDLNDDGLLDSTQPDVTTYVNPIVSGYVASEIGGTDCNQIDQVSYHLESDLAAEDPDYDYFIGLHGIELSCGVTGGTVTITHYWDQEYDITNWQYRKYVNGSYIDFNDQVTYGTADVGGNTVTTVTFSITDGGPYDSDGVANGEILDPVGPAVLGELADTGTPAFTSFIAGAFIAITAIATSTVLAPVRTEQ